jgi:glutamyl-tRNA reductase
MEIIVLGISHKTAPVAVRERYSVSDRGVSDTLSRLCRLDGVSGAVLLSTCNRVEVYAEVESLERGLVQAMRCELAEGADQDAAGDDEGFYELGSPESVRHLFKVASGLDSMVLGETEILGQLKQAYSVAMEAGATCKALNKAFQTAFNVAKKIRTDTNIQRGSVSVASVSVELAQKIFESLSEQRVMVIGAGDTSEKTARALQSRGASSILVSNRSFERAEALARELDGEAIHFDDWPKEFSRIDIVISSTSAPHHLITRRSLAPLLSARGSRPLLLIDIAVPRDIDPEVNQLDEVYLYNVDDLQAIADEYQRLRREELDVCERIIADKARGLLGGESGDRNTRGLTFEGGLA